MYVTWYTIKKDNSFRKVSKDFIKWEARGESTLDLHAFCWKNETTEETIILRFKKLEKTFGNITLHKLCKDDTKTL